MPRHSKRKGLTILELCVSATIFSIVLFSFGRGLADLNKTTSVASVQGRLHDLGHRALNAITEDVRRSGFITESGKDYPTVFDDGDAPLNFPVHDHAPAGQTYAEPGDVDFGSDREIIFLVPADADANGVPDVVPGGTLAWDAREVSYVRTTRADGISYLERRLDGALDQTIASHVERVVFDDPPSSGFAVPLGAVRVQIFFRMPDADGLVHSHSAETMMRLRNGQ